MMEYLKRLLQYSRRYHGLNTLGLLLALGTIALGLVIPYLSKILVDDVLIAGNFSDLGGLIILILIVALGKTVMQYAKLYIFEYTSQGVLYDLRSDLFDVLQRQSFAFFDQVRTGLLMNRLVGDLQSIRQLLNTGYVHLFESCFALVTTFAIMLAMDVTLTVAVFFMVPVLYLITRAMSSKLRPTFRRIRQSFEHLTSTVQENITGIFVVKAFGKEDQEKDKAYQAFREFRDNNILAAKTRSDFVPLARLVNGLGSLVILLLGGYLVMVDRITIGALVAFNGYMVLLQQPINHISGLVNQWENALSSLEKIFELMDARPAIENKPHATSLAAFKGKVVLENVYFAYRENIVLRDINLTLEPGQITAIMGDTGAGKSTIINLIGRHYDCTKGRILIDGTDVRDLEINSLRRNIGVILQETFLFSDTIANNIAFAKPDASSEEIERAAEMADAHQFIMEMPAGYQTVVGDRGLGLSGGQRQRIAIARALLCDPPILILDDATSSVDMETEHEIQQTLRTVMEGRTTLIIAHRISSVKDADQIVVLDNGQIVEKGTHQELINKQGKYYCTLIEQYGEYHQVKRGKRVAK